MWNAEAVAETLVDDGLLRRRPSGYFPTPGVDPHPAVDIRGSSGGQIAILEADTGRMLGSAGVGQAPASVHPGAVYLHQGESYVVDSLDFEDGVAFVHAEDPGYTTFARELTDIAVTGQGERNDLRAGDRRPGAGVGDQHRDRLSAPPAGRRGDRLRRTRHADPHSGHHRGDVHDHAGGIAAQRNRTAARTGRAACRRTRGDRPAATGRQLRPRRHRRRVDSGRSGDRACRRSSSTTAIPAGPASPTAASGRSTHGGARRRRRSRPANARSAARRACSRRSAATAMIRSTRRARCVCCAWCWRELERRAS